MEPPSIEMLVALVTNKFKHMLVSLQSKKLTKWLKQ